MQTYNFKLIDFLGTRNTIKIENQNDLIKLKNLLRKINLENILCGNIFESYEKLREVAEINHHNNEEIMVCLEYDNSRGITFYTNEKESIDWFDCFPFTVDEIIAEL